MSDAGTTPNDDDPALDDPAVGPVDGADAAPSVERERAPADLDAIGRDLAGVEAALSRLDDGSYWTDEVTGEPIPDEVLAADPVARRVAPQ